MQVCRGSDSGSATHTSAYTCTALGRVTHKSKASPAYRSTAPVTRRGKLEAARRAQLVDFPTEMVLFPGGRRSVTHFFNCFKGQKRGHTLFMVLLPEVFWVQSQGLSFNRSLDLSRPFRIDSFWKRFQPFRDSPFPLLPFQARAGELGYSQNNLVFV